MSALSQKYYRISVLFLSLLLLSRPSQAEEIVTAGSPHMELAQR